MIGCLVGVGWVRVVGGGVGVGRCCQDRDRESMDFSNEGWRILIQGIQAGGRRACGGSRLCLGGPTVIG